MKYSINNLVEKDFTNSFILKTIEIIKYDYSIMRDCFYVLISWMSYITIWSFLWWKLTPTNL